MMTEEQHRSIAAVARVILTNDAPNEDVIMSKDMGRGYFSCGLRVVEVEATRGHCEYTDHASLHVTCPDTGERYTMALRLEGWYWLTPPDWRGWSDLLCELQQYYKRRNS